MIMAVRTHITAITIGASPPIILASVWDPLCMTDTHARVVVVSDPVAMPGKRQHR